MVMLSLVQVVWRLREIGEILKELSQFLSVED